jgi:hypothetical protein
LPGKYLKKDVDDVRYLCGSLFFRQAAMLMASAHRQGKTEAAIVIEGAIIYIS